MAVRILKKETLDHVQLLHKQWINIINIYRFQFIDWATMKYSGLHMYTQYVIILNSLGKFFIPVLWPVMQNRASTDDVYYRFWWSATYCPNHLVNYRPDLMLLSYFGCKLLRAKMQVCFESLWSALFFISLFLLEIPSYLWRWCKCVYMYLCY